MKTTNELCQEYTTKIIVRNMLVKNSERLMQEMLIAYEVDKVTKLYFELVSRGITNLVPPPSTSCQFKSWSGLTGLRV